MKTAVFINLNSRQTRHLASRIKADLADSQFKAAHFITVGTFRRFDTGLKRLRALSNVECAIIAGGDGTVTGVLNEIGSKKRSIGILPLGTGNSFARSLGLPLDYEQAMAVIKTGRKRQAATAQVNGRIFVNTAASA